MRNHKSLMAAAVLLALGATGQAFAQQNERGDGDNNAVHVEDYSGNNRDNTTYTATDSFNVNTAVANTQLQGAVTGNDVYDIGNHTRNSGDADGGDGGNGGKGGHAWADGGKGSGGDGGDAGAISAREGDSDAGSSSGALGLAGSENNADSRARVRERGDGDADADARARNRADSTADADSTSGDATASNSGSSGNANAGGGAGGAASGGDAAAVAGTGGNGGDGSDGGATWADGGSFDMSNTMSGSANAAAGIMVMAQNSGATSLIQQGVTVQANLSVGP